MIICGAVCKSKIVDLKLVLTSEAVAKYRSRFLLPTNSGSAAAAL